MTEETEFETYLSITPNKFGIYVFDTKNSNNLYDEEFKLQSNNQNLNDKFLIKFLEKNIFKIEKLTGKFIKNIYLLIDSKNILNLSIGIKKKNYSNIINNKYLQNILTDAKDLFNENYQDYKIMHIIIKNYLVDNIHYSKLKSDLKGDQLCLELSFLSIRTDLCKQIEKILENYQIKVIKYLDKNYLEDFFKASNLQISQMAHKILNGHNLNEVKIVPKIVKKFGFFEKFFQLFS